MSRELRFGRRATEREMVRVARDAIGDEYAVTSAGAVTGIHPRWSFAILAVLLIPFVTVYARGFSSAADWLTIIPPALLPVASPYLWKRHLLVITPTRFLVVRGGGRWALPARADAVTYSRSVVSLAGWDRGRRYAMLRVSLPGGRQTAFYVDNVPDFAAASALREALAGPGPGASD